MNNVRLLIVFFVKIVLGGVRYEMYSSTNWNRARDSCVSRGGVLAKVRDEESNLELVQLLESRGEILEGVWLGAQDRHKEGDWKWVADGSRVLDESYQKWCEGSPTNANPLTDCMVLLAADKCWTDMLCALPLPYACEFTDNNEEPEEETFQIAPNSICREELYGTSGTYCFNVDEDTDCVLYCENHYELALVAASSTANICCCHSRCSCIEFADGSDRQLSVKTQTPQCDDQDIATVCSRLGYNSQEFSYDGARLIFQDLTCGDALQIGASIGDEASIETSIIVACCCEDTACCPDQSMDECLSDTVDHPTISPPIEAKYHPYSGVSCRQETGFDDNFQCYALDYDAISDDPTHACWEHCVTEYFLPLSASWGRRSTSECCCVNKCSCFERDDDDVHLAIIDYADGPSNDYSEVEQCDETTDNIVTAYEKFEATSCRVDSALLNADDYCYRHDYSITERGRDDPASECVQLCQTLYNLPLAVAYGDSDKDKCCCATACLCLEQVGQHAFVSIAASKDGPFNDINEVVTCATLAASVSSGNTNNNGDTLGAAAIVVLSIGLVAASFSLLIALLYKRNMRAHRLIRSFVPNTTAVDQMNDDDPSILVYAHDVELMPAGGDGREQAVI